ncbi:MAG: hypothetical protein ACYDEJ_16695 [Desulfitobacteriaceae bacterium]
MKQSNNDIEAILGKALEQHSKSIPFESVWSTHLKNNKKIFGLKKATAILVITVITFFAICIVGLASNFIRNIDKTNYPFVKDPRAIGKWESVDFVENVNDFIPGKKSEKEDLYLTALAFIKEGKMLMSSSEIKNLTYTTFSWTKDKVLNKQEKTSSRYEIKEINGLTYMFFEWKSGDYTFRNMNPMFYVLKKVDSDDYSNFQVARKEDKIDYPFVDNVQMKGNWESVDFVKTIDNFKPGEKSWLDDLFLTGLTFDENGKLTATTTSGEFSESWTDDMIINRDNKTASKCTIKMINGLPYMFYEWKNGDYTNGGMMPYFYVLKKVK